MNTQEKIDFIYAFLRGEKIQRRQVDCNAAWRDYNFPGDPSLRWDLNEYRVKPAEPKKVKLLAWLTTYGLVWRLEVPPARGDWVRVPSEDKEITLP